MTTLPPHCMNEVQAMAVFAGQLDKLSEVHSFRAGQAQVKGRTPPNQLCRTRNIPEPFVAELNLLASGLRTLLDTFPKKTTQVRAQALIRYRMVDGIHGYRQSFKGYWGTLSAPGQWNLGFGRHFPSEAVFRRGPWDEWRPREKRLRRVNTRKSFIFSPYCATLLHEAVGHALETEYLASSPLSAFRGKRCSGEALFVMDRPDVFGAPGAMTHDDVGLPATQTALIYKGFLVGDLAQGRGAYRRANYKSLPLVRATNFTINPGSGSPSSWIEDTRETYYVCWIQSGHWQPGTTQIRLLTGPVFRLKKGEVRSHCDWTYLDFDVVDLLARIEDVGNDFQMDPLVHWCTKQNQPVPLGMGSPSILVGGRP